MGIEIPRPKSRCCEVKNWACLKDNATGWCIGFKHHTFSNDDWYSSNINLGTSNLGRDCWHYKFHGFNSSFQSSIGYSFVCFFPVVPYFKTISSENKSLWRQELRLIHSMPLAPQKVKDKVGMHKITVTLLRGIHMQWLTRTTLLALLKINSKMTNFSDRYVWTTGLRNNKNSPLLQIFNLLNNFYYSIYIFSNHRTVLKVI